MPKYRITEKAGPYVAGTRNLGVGTEIDVAERAAEQDVRVGALIEVDPPKKATAKKADAKADDETKTDEGDKKPEGETKGEEKKPEEPPRRAARSR